MSFPPPAPPAPLHAPAPAQPPRPSRTRWLVPECRAAARAGRGADRTWEGEHRGARVVTVGAGVRRCFVYDIHVNAATTTGPGEAPGRMAVYRPGRRDPVDELDIEDASGASPMYVDDFDFDGYQDLALVSTDNMHNASYDFYLYDPRTGGYAYWRDDNTLVPDARRRVLTQYQRGSCCAGSLLTFRVRGRGPGATLVLIEQEDHEPNERRGGTDFVRLRRRHGRMVVVKRWHRAEGLPPREGG